MMNNNILKDMNPIENNYNEIWTLIFKKTYSSEKPRYLNIFPGKTNQFY